MGGKGTISATNLAAHHHLNCDLYLYNVYHGRQSAAGGGTVQAPSDLSKAQFSRGVDWESHLLSWLEQNDLLLTIPSIPTDGSVFYENLQCDDRDHFYVAGFTFVPPRELLDKRFLEVGNDPVRFGMAKPDLLEIHRTSTGVTWKVIDAKASGAVKTSHHVQIYFYTLCLSYLLPPPYFLPSGTAAIWLPPADGFDAAPPSLDDVKTVNISLLSPSLDYFLFRKLPRILSLPPSEVPWHFNPSCKGCPYTLSCQTRAVEDGDLGGMSNISLEEVKVLRNLLGLSRTRTGSKLPDIEDLAHLLEDRASFQDLSKHYPVTVKKAKRILALPSRDRPGPIQSPLIEAARLSSIHIKRHRNFTCPRREDVAIVLSLLQDPSTPGQEIASFYITPFSSSSFGPILPDVPYGTGEQLVSSLASIIRKVMALPIPPLTQFYVFSPGEYSALQSHLINAALMSTHNGEDVRLCIGALSQGASLLQTTFQPVLLSGALLDFLAKGNRTKAELQGCLERMQLPANGTVAELRKRIQDELARYQAKEKTRSEERRKELGQLPHVVVLKREVERLLALPIPGFWDLPECASVLVPSTNIGYVAPSDEEIYNSFISGGNTMLLMQKRNRSIFAVLQNLRKHLKTCGLDLLVNDAKVLSSNFMDVCREQHLRKLFFMQQFEVLAKLSELWKARIDGCPEAPILEYHSTEPGAKGVEHVFHLKSGSLDMAASDKDRSFYDHLLAEDIMGDDIPVEALFDDLGVSGLVFPLNKYTRPKWDQQHPSVQSDLLLADLRDISTDGHRIRVVIQTWNGASSIKFVRGHLYRISPRLVDFNVTKVLSTLLEMDLNNIPNDEAKSKTRAPFLQLMLDPKAFGRERESFLVEAEKRLKKSGTSIQRLFRELKRLDVDSANPLVLKDSQNKAALRILSNRLSVVWGPPGTGKTHTISLSLLRLLEAQYYATPDGRRIVFITAMTHAAIQACLKKLAHLISCYRSIQGLPTEWMDCLQIEHVVRGNDHPAPPKSPGSYVYAGTVFQLYNFSKRHSFVVDCVVIDEAGQLALSSSALVLRSLSHTGKMVIAGDSEQLAPILTAQYPQLKTGHIFGSILDCLMYWSRNPNTIPGDTRPASPAFSENSNMSWSQETVVQLTENFRLNPDLGEFVSTIYSRAFKPQKFQARQLATALNSIQHDFGKDLGVQPDVLDAVQWFLLALSNVMFRQPQTILTQPAFKSKAKKQDPQEVSEIDTAPHAVSLALIRLQTVAEGRSEGIGYEVHVKAEAAVAAALVISLRRCSPQDDIFVATPHRIQRQAVKAALASARSKSETLSDAMERLRVTNGEQPESSALGRITVDTIERLQGSEAAFVICLFSMPQSSPSELGFLLQRRRLNVAISRAKTLCILVASNEVLRPSVHVLADEGNAKGYAFMRAFEDRAWSSTIEVDIDALQL